MNVNIPLGESRYGFLIIILITGAISGIVTYILAKKNMF